MRLFSLCILLLFTFSAFSQKKYDLVKDFHAVANDRTDCYNAFKAAATAISKAGGGILNIPKGKYYIGRYKNPAGKDPNDVTDINFSGCNGLRINGNGSSIRMTGRFLRTSDYSNPGVPYRYSYKNSVCPIRIADCKNVRIENLVLDGGVREMKKESVVEGESHGIIIDDASGKNYVSRNIFITNVSANYFAADGFYIRCKGENIVLSRCSASHNGRQGLSISAGKHIIIEKSVFDSTGYTGAYGYHEPSAGIDVESELGTGLLSDVVIKNCRLSANRGFQVVTTLQSENVLIDSCFIADNTGGYSDGLNGVGMYSLHSALTNCIIFGSLQVDLAGQIYTGPVIQEFRHNIIYSGTRAITCSDFQRPCNISENMIVMLPHAAVNDFFPYIQSVNCVFDNNVIMMQYDKIVRRQNEISGLLQNVKESKNNFWLMNGYPSPGKRVVDFYYSIAFSSAGTFPSQFCPPGKSISVLCTQAPKDIVQKINSSPLFTAYYQNRYNRKYLAEATSLWQYLAGKIKGFDRK